MKKLISILLALTVLFSLAGCSKKADEAEKLPRETTTEKKDAQDIPDKFLLNSQYLDLLGEKKEDIDAFLGIGEYSNEFGMTDYKIGVMIGWNSLGYEPEDNDEAVSIYITLENLFHNCPEVLTTEEISALFADSYTEYSPMDDENVFCANYKGNSLLFYPDSGLHPDSYAFMNISTPYALPSGEYYEGDVSESDIKGDSSYYEFAMAHDDEFWNINKDWRDDREYYYLADVDRDSRDELVVKLGCGVAIFKETGSGVEEVFKDTLPDSSGSVNYWVVTYDGVDYIAYTSASSSEYTVLNKLSGNKLSKACTSQIIDGEYFVNDENVTESQYKKYIDSIEYHFGISKEKLK